MAVHVLSVHARYGCRHSGACCTSNWPIPIEVDRLDALRGALATGALEPAIGPNQPPFELPPDAPPETPAILGRIGGRCVFYDADAPDGRCRIHGALGHAALPLACRQFPRVVVHDPRGVSVTLSHYCPTAASLVLQPEADGLVAVLSDTRAFPSAAEYIGLDARRAMPPLLRPNLLMDWESWWEVERSAVALLTSPSESVEASLARLRAAVEHARAWTPGSEGTLLEQVRSAFDPSRGTGETTRAALRPQDVVASVFGAIPADLLMAAPIAAGPGAIAIPQPAAGRFLAAHAFANWTAHLGQGLRSWLRSIEAAAALLTAGYDIRHADLLLRHLADPEQLAAHWSRAETE